MIAAPLMLLLLLAAGPAQAHSTAESGSAPDLVLVTVCALVLFVYLVGLVRARRRGLRSGSASWRRGVCFLAGWGLLLLTIAPGIQHAAETSFAFHMAEHEVLMVAVAPLLILAHPMGVFAWGLPASGRRELAALAGSRVLRVLTRPSVAWALQAAALWLWHMPRLFEAALASPVLHILQHACFLISALLFWWSLFHGGAGAMRHGAALLSLFTTVIHTSLLGALLTVSPIVWYASLAADPSSGLADQQLAGIIMWVPGGILYVAEALWVAADWMRVSEARTRNWERSAAVSRHVG